MGNSNGKQSRAHGRHHAAGPRHPPDSTQTSPSSQASVDRPGRPAHRDRNAHGNRPDLASYLSLGLADRDSARPEQHRETKQEKEARKFEKERANREQEREQSIKHETVDGGYLVTLGTYTGPEDFSKPIVRQLQIERRLAPFWKGLNDHDQSWTEYQLVAAVRGLPIPAADEIPTSIATSTQDTDDSRPNEAQAQRDMVPITRRSQSMQSGSSSVRGQQPERSQSQLGYLASCAPTFRARSKTLASLTTSKSNSTTQLAPQEISLPHIDRVNGQPLEAHLYKDAAECPICFLCYPPYLNRTRCCDQSICSECFVQIKRPDPHPPEHHINPTGITADAPGPNETRPPEQEADQLVSEPSQCPFCVTPEFGVTYEPPQAFRSGLVYTGSSHTSNQAGLIAGAPAMSSSTSFGSSGGEISRRRTTSLSAEAPSVITTDRIRPDWAKKLSDARAHALRCSAAATALHNAAYILGSDQQIDPRILRSFSTSAHARRSIFGDLARDAGSSSRGPSLGGEGIDLIVGRRTSSRRVLTEELERAMLAEAIRLSLETEEDRKKKESKDSKKEEKRKAKETAKEDKKSEKEARKASKSSLYPASINESTSTWSSATAPTQPLDNPAQQHIRSATSAGSNPSLMSPNWPLPAAGKGKGPAAVANRSGLAEDLQQSRDPPNNIGTDASNRAHDRRFSTDSSVASSVRESSNDSFPTQSKELAIAPAEVGATDTGSSTPHNTQSTYGLEPMLNFQSLAAIIGSEDKKTQHIENIVQVETGSRPASTKEHSTTSMVDARRPEQISRGISSASSAQESRGNSDESVAPDQLTGHAARAA